MLKLPCALAAGVLLLAQPAHAAAYDCAKKETAVKLNDFDITIEKRAAAIAEMHAEIKEVGGSTEQQKKALQSFEDKLAQAKQAREELAKECSGTAQP